MGVVYPLLVMFHRRVNTSHYHNIAFSKQGFIEPDGGHFGKGRDTTVITILMPE